MDAHSVLIGVGTIAGAIAGSFLSTIALRWPAGGSVATGRSRCDQCGATLGVRDLVPILSWLWTRGRCRHCGRAIAHDHILIEVAAALIGGAAMAFAPGWGGAALALLGWQLLLSGWLDARHFWLPHVLSAVLCLSGLALGGQAMAALGMAVPLTDRLIAAVAGYALLWLVGAGYRRMRGRDGLGGGDAPFLGAMGAWTGWQLLPFLLLLAALGGIAIALARHGRGATARGTAGLAEQRLPLGTLLALALPFALAVAQRL